MPTARRVALYAFLAGAVVAIVTAQVSEGRKTAASILVHKGAAATGPSVTTATKQISMRAAISDTEVAPGDRIAIVFEVTPNRGVHVYAPGKHSYRVVRPTIHPQPWLRVLAPVYPASEVYHFKPLDERVEVYTKPFRLVQDVTILATPEVQNMLAARPTIGITGMLEYQACDDQLCYDPQLLPVHWTLQVKPLKRK